MSNWLYTQKANLIWSLDTQWMVHHLKMPWMSFFKSEHKVKKVVQTLYILCCSFFYDLHICDQRN